MRPNVYSSLPPLQPILIPRPDRSASLWRTGSLFLLLACLAAALIGVLSHLFEQVDRRSEEARRKHRGPHGQVFIRGVEKRRSEKH